MRINWDHQFANASFVRGTLSISCSYSTSTLGPRLAFFSGPFFGGFEDRVCAFRFPSATLLFRPSSFSSEPSSSSSSSSSESSSPCDDCRVRLIHTPKNEEKGRKTYESILQVTQAILVSTNVADKFSITPPFVLFLQFFFFFLFVALLVLHLDAFLSSLLPIEHLPPYLLVNVERCIPVRLRLETFKKLGGDGPLQLSCRQRLSFSRCFSAVQFLFYANELGPMDRTRLMGVRVSKRTEKTYSCRNRKRRILMRYWVIFVTRCLHLCIMKLGQWMSSLSIYACFNEA